MSALQIRNQEKKAQLDALVAFEKQYQGEDDGFATSELASKYARLRLEWWGSNLVFLGIEEKNGRFFPGFGLATPEFNF